MNKELISDILEEAAGFLNKKRSAILSTISSSNMPSAGYSPFYRDGAGIIFIFVSTLSAHTSNLKNGAASVMFIEDESESKQIYARRRLIYECKVEMIPRDNPIFSPTVDELQQRHGEIIGTLRSLDDFILFRMIPVNGRYIRGFGQAYRVDRALKSLSPMNG